MDSVRHEENPEQSKQTFWQRWKGYQPIEKMTFVMATFAVIYSLITLGLYCISRETVQEMQKSNRPYVFTDARFSFPQMPTPENIREIPVTVFIFNVGTSPALNTVNSEPIVGLETDSNVGEHLRTCTFDYQGGAGVPLPPNQSFSGSGMTSHTVTRTLSDDEKKDVIINKTKHIVVLGGVKYSGVRAGDYETTYCYIWNADSLTSRSFPWITCPSPCFRIK